MEQERQDSSLCLYRVTAGNFGDDLNELVIRPLMPSTAGTRYLDATRFPEGRQHETLVVGIGTILNQRIPKASKKIVFGAGAGYGPAPEVNRRWEVRFVRGPRTAASIGVSKESVVTDPAILLVDWAKDHGFSNGNGPEGGVCLMPHLISANRAWQDLCRKSGITYLDPAGDVCENLSLISRSRLVLAEAMHAAIAADALRVPWVPIHSGKAVNVFKWRDWCESMDIEYKPFQLLPLWDVFPEQRQRRVFQRVKSRANRKLLGIVSSKINKPTLSRNDTHQKRLRAIRSEAARLQEDLVEGAFRA